MIKYLISFLILCSFNLSAQKLIPLRDSINKYYYSFNRQKLMDIASDCKKELSTHPDNFYLNYYLGLIYYNLCKINFLPNEEIALKQANQSIDYLKDAWDIKKIPEVAGLISAAYGKKSALSGINAFFWGLKSKSWIEEAFELDSNNSKLNLIAATHLMHIPKMYGGDKKKARLLLEKSLENNKKRVNQNDQLLLKWAENAEIYAYLAQISILEKNIQEAQHFIELSISLQPNYDFVLIDLQKQFNKINP